MVEYEGIFVKDEIRIKKIGRSGVFFRQLLKKAHRVIGEISYRPKGEAALYFVGRKQGNAGVKEVQGVFFS